MSYYKIFGLQKEPFSTSPDPEFFFDSADHWRALLRAMIEIRLKRGLNVILGDVGIGKTTLSRKLFQMLKERNDIVFHMILDPTYESEQLFLESLARTFCIKVRSKGPANILDYKEAIKDYLFQQGVKEKKIVVLLIDEAQKLNTLSLEVLRVLLNYETNEHKLLQVILVGQMELLDKMRLMPNFWDRIGLKHILHPLSAQETRRMIDFRLAKAGLVVRASLFDDDAVKEIHDFTRGYPRRIVMVCHDALKTLFLENKNSVDVDTVRQLVRQEVF